MAISNIPRIKGGIKMFQDKLAYIEYLMDTKNVKNISIPGQITNAEIDKFELLNYEATRQPLGYIKFQKKEIWEE